MIIIILQGACTCPFLFHFDGPSALIHRFLDLYVLAMSVSRFAKHVSAYRLWKSQNGTDGRSTSQYMSVTVQDGSDNIELPEVTRSEPSLAERASADAVRAL